MYRKISRYYIEKDGGLSGPMKYKEALARLEEDPECKLSKDKGYYLITPDGPKDGPMTLEEMREHQAQRMGKEKMEKPKKKRKKKEPKGD